MPVIATSQDSAPLLVLRRHAAGVTRATNQRLVYGDSNYLGMKKAGISGRKLGRIQLTILLVEFSEALVHFSTALRLQQP